MKKDDQNIGKSFSIDDLPSTYMLIKNEKVSSMNEIAHSLTGYASTTEPVPLSEIFEGADLAILLNKINSIEPKDFRRMDAILLTKGKKRIHVELFLSRPHKEKAILCCLNPVEKRYDFQNKLFERERQFASLLKNLPGIAYRCKIDEYWTMEFLSEGCYEVTGYTPEQLIENNELAYADLISEEDKEYVSRTVLSSVEKREMFTLVYRIKTAKDDIKWVWEKGQSFENEKGEKRLEGFISDITDRIKYEKEFQESRTLYEQLVETSPDAIILLHPEGIIKMSNSKTAELFGYADPNAFVGKSIYDYVYPEYKFPLEKCISSTMITNEPAEKELIFKKGNDVIFWGDVRASVIRDNHGNVQMITLIIRDTTERNITDENLRKSREKYKAILAAVPDLIFLIDNEGTFLDYKAEIGQDLIQKPDYFIHRNVYEVVPKYIADLTLTHIKKAVKTNKMQKYEYMLINAKGQREDFESRVVPAGRGECLAIVRNITERKRAERELISEKERLDITLSSIGDGVISTDTKGNITLINKVAEKVLKVRKTDVMGHPITKYFKLLRSRDKKPLSPPPFKAVLVDKKTIDYTENILLVLPDSQHIEIGFSLSPVKATDGTLIGSVLAFRDITDILQMQDEMVKSQRLESLGVLAGGIAHDFKNILTVISGNIQLAEMFYDKKEQTLEILREAYDASDKAVELTQQFLTFSKGGAPVKKAASLFELLEESITFTSRGSSITPKIKAADGLWNAEVDSGQISQVVNNLVLNAIQAMGDNGKLTVSASNVKLKKGEHHTLPAGNYIKIDFEDNGPGIPEETLAKIWDPYFTTKDAGNGLGLSSCYSIISKHEGHISVTSKVGKGTTFTILLPTLGKSGKLKSMRSAEELKRGSGRILLMDDKEGIRDLTKRMLAGLGYFVTAVSDGDKLLKEYNKSVKQKKPFDLYIMDLIIAGGMGGKQTVKKLLAKDPKAKVIVVSAFSRDDSITNHKALGFAGSLKKPFKLEEMAELVFQIINS
ncbi:PAS domain S-box protein [bacterium]|nr:PAS domain S-box protein [bacterium]